MQEEVTDLMSGSDSRFHSSSSSSSSSSSLPPSLSFSPMLSGVEEQFFQQRDLRKLLFNPKEPRIKADIIRIICQFLHDEGFHLSATVLQDESQIQLNQSQRDNTSARRIKQLILDGHWQEIEQRLFQDLPSLRPRELKSALLYSVMKQQYLELLEQRQTSKAFTHLMEKLKPLEALQSVPDELQQLCFLLTIPSVQMFPQEFRQLLMDKQAARERLVAQFQSILDYSAWSETPSSTSAGLSGMRYRTQPSSSLSNPSSSKWTLSSPGSPSFTSNSSLASRVFRPAPGQQDLKRWMQEEIPPHRLIALLNQATAYQLRIEPLSHEAFQTAKPPNEMRIETLLRDHSRFVLPKNTALILRGHTANVKTIAFSGSLEKSQLISGSSDNTLRLWDLDLRHSKDSKQEQEQEQEGEITNGSKASYRVLEGHTSRIWSVETTGDGRIAASASGDSTIKIWDLENTKCLSTISGQHKGDVFSVAFHPTATHCGSGGYDHQVRLFDVERGQLAKTFSGHKAPVTSVIFNSTGNLIISGSKDNTIKFWDICSGICIKTFSGHLAEIASVQIDSSGTQLLSCAKDNSNRLWDIRASRMVQRFKGHQHTSKNFVRAIFGSEQKVVIGGSECGDVFVWDTQSGSMIDRLTGHQDIVYDVCWDSRSGLFASCSQDKTIRVWTE